MLKIELSSEEGWDEQNECFVEAMHQTITLEHSLISISKWESKFHKPYTAKGDKTLDENLYYIECMIITPNFDPKILSLLSEDNLKVIGDYINDPMTATTICRPKTKGGNGKKEILTSELIYYYMTAFNIPVEFQKWHLNRLTTLIQVCDAKQQQQNGGEPISTKEAVSRHAAQNAAMRKKYNSKG